MCTNDKVHNSYSKHEEYIWTIVAPLVCAKALFWNDIVFVENIYYSNFSEEERGEKTDTENDKIL